MKKILLLDPGVSSFNRGDEIISDGVIKNLNYILEKNFVTSVSTHTPLNLVYIKHLKDYDMKFVCGSNLLMGRLNGLFRQWDVSFKSAVAVKGCILVGAGWWKYNTKPNFYTKILYRSILSKDVIHSVRDEYTKNMLESIGIKNVINTGCATMWNFTPEFCRKIPTKKSDTVIFTLTDYKRDIRNDKAIVDLLVKNYNKVCYWVQGEKDYDYLMELGEYKNIEIINGTLKEYDNFLDNNDCDYVGTRLHGGIRALQKKRRSIIISIDNRAEEKKKDFNIPCVSRTNIDDIEYMIKNDFATEINIPLENINKWKAQFEHEK